LIRRAYPSLAVIALTLTMFSVACSNQKPNPGDSRSISAQLEAASLSPEWLTYGHDYANQRFSALTEIDSGNVTRLIPAYVFQTGVLGPFESTPIISRARLYLTTAYDGVFAINARTGDQVWTRPPLSAHYRICCGPVNRGVAIADGLVLIGELDGTLVALSQESGHVIWSAKVADNAAGYSITMAPLVYKNSVFVGVAGGEFGIRGSLSSFSLREGRLQWRWYSTDPQHWFGTSTHLLYNGTRLNRALSTRLRKQFADSWKHGGGGIWTTPAVDPDRNTIYVTTGNPWPDADGRTRPGDNLFTDCVIALDADTGRMKWYFQQTPHDTGDLDAASPPALFETVDDSGHKVAAVGEVGKNGLFYILNRNTGGLIRRSQNLASVGRAVRGSRGWEGGSGWSPISIDPGLGYAVVSAAQHLKPETSATHGGDANESIRNAHWDSGYGTVSAVDLTSGKIVWQDEFDQGLIGGAVSTAGGVTFVGEGNGDFDALDTKSGVRLWQFQTGAGVNAAPVVFQVDNREYVAVASGGNQQFGTPLGDALFVFRLAD
jgi:alcohol dehydrogenase (cytochrome c)